MSMTAQALSIFSHAFLNIIETDGHDGGTALGRMSPWTFIGTGQ